jgi:NAD(P)-dependent dehydrogenase (short-subunit alcohol dehydrogenase family)
MNSQFEGKYALVTGGNKGIGFAISKGLLAAGFDVIIAARSPKQGADTAIWLATEASPNLSRKFRDRWEISD